RRRKREGRLRLLSAPGYHDKAKRAPAPEIGWSMGMADESEPDLFADGRQAPPRALTRLSPLVRRLIAPNASPFTFNGTCTYIVGDGAVAVVDPGPNDDSHLAAILAAVAGGQVEIILVTHTHRDHSAGAR